MSRVKAADARVLLSQTISTEPLYDVIIITHLVVATVQS